MVSVMNIVYCAKSQNKAYGCRKVGQSRDLDLTDHSIAILFI